MERVRIVCMRRCFQTSAERDGLMFLQGGTWVKGQN